MKNLVKLLVFCFLLSAVSAQSQTCKTLINKIDTLWHSGKFDLSLVQFADSVCLKEVGAQDSLYSDVLAQKGIARIYTGDYPGGLSNLKKAKEISLSSRGLYNQSTGSIYSALGLASIQSGQAVQAISAMDTSLMIKKHLHDTTANYSTALSTRGQIYMLMGRLKEAKSDIWESVQIIKKHKLDTTTYMYLVKLNVLGMIMQQLGENTEAIPVLEENVNLSIMLFGESNWSTIVSMISQGQNYIALGRISLALPILQKAYALACGIDAMHPNTNSSRIAIANCYMDLGEYSKANALLYEVLAIENQQHKLNPADYATLLSDIGVLHSHTKNYTVALTYLTEARSKIAAALGRKNLRYALINSNLSACHALLGNSKTANALALESLALADEIGDGFLNMEKYLSNTSISDENAERALTLISKSIEVTKKRYGENSIEYAFQFMAYGAKLSNIGRDREAHEWLSKAEELANKTNRSSSVVHVDISRNLATSFWNLGQLDMSLLYYQKALKQSETISTTETANNAFLLQGEAGVHERIGNTSKALARYIQADTLLRLVTARNFAVLSDAGREFFLANVQSQKDHWLSFVWRHHKKFPEVAGVLFDNLLTEKGQLLHSAHSVQAALRNNKVLFEQFSEWQGLRQRIDHQRGLLAQNDPKSLYNHKQLDSMNVVADLLESQLSQNSKAFADAVTAANWRKVQAQLSNNEVAVEFFHFKYNKVDRQTDSTVYGALILRKSDKKPRFVPLFEEKQLIEIISKEGLSHSEWLSKVYPDQSPAPSELYDLLWKPLEKHLKSTQRVWYAPSGLLHHVSFAAISKSQGKRLGQLLDLQRVGSTREMDTPQSLPAAPPTTAYAYACVSYPTDVHKMGERTRECIGGDEITGRGSLGTPSQLPYSLLEAEQFEKQLTSKGAKVSTYIGYQPLEEDLKTQLNKPVSPDILLYSTHGFVWDTLPEYFKGRFPPKNPMYASGLLLAGCDQMLTMGKADSLFSDGILLAREIGDLNLNNTRLVILSACESGLGEANTIEGVFGLQRAFKLAGAQQVLATLWEIPDSPETVEFVGEFTKRYLENNDARAALRDTQRDFAQKGKNKQVWAAWVLI